MGFGEAKVVSWDQIVTWLVLPAFVAIVCGVGGVLWARHITGEKN
jgi:hypothetical protein